MEFWKLGAAWNSDMMCHIRQIYPEIHLQALPGNLLVGLSELGSSSEEPDHVASDAGDKGMFSDGSLLRLQHPKSKKSKHMPGQHLQVKPCVK